VVDRPADRHNSVRADTAKRRLDRGHAVGRGGRAKAAARVGSSGSGNHPRRERRAAAAARAAHRLAHVPGISALWGEYSESELVGMRVPEQHHPGVAQLRPHGRVARRDVSVEHMAGGGQRQALNRVQVLEGQRDAAQRRRGLAGTARSSQRFVGRGRLRGSQTWVQPDPRIDRRWRAIERHRAVAPRDPGLTGSRDLGARDQTGLEQRGGLQHTEVARVRVLGVDRRRRGKTRGYLLGRRLTPFVTGRGRFCANSRPRGRAAGRGDQLDGRRAHRRARGYEPATAQSVAARSFPSPAISRVRHRLRLARSRPDSH